jgi:hydroxyacylglutathione hydrolase
VITPMRIVAVPCLKDNYAYLIVCEKTGASAIVDASEGSPVLGAVKREKLEPRAIWSTHHHLDHVGGNEQVTEGLGISDVYGYATDRGRIPAQTTFLEDGETFKLGSINVRALHIPGHTLGAVAYFCEDGGEPAVFTGDTLFIAGCGRLFEGTPAQMFHSLAKLAALPSNTRVYCGHEYTEANLRFAAHVEPQSEAILAAQARAKELRMRGEPTVPGTLRDELATNPFVRACSVDELAERRSAKDSFR